MSAPYDFVAGDTNAIIEARFIKLSDRRPYDLTGATPKIRIKRGSEAPIERTMTIEGDPVNGVARYRFEVGELVAGRFQSEGYVESAGRVLTGLEVRTYTVRPALGG